MTSHPQKLDLKKARKEFFSAPSGRFVPLNVPPFSYLMIDGHGDPNSAPQYSLAVQSLYATAYAIKFRSKADGRDFVVPPLEGLWSAADPESFTARRKHEWDWTLMIMLPDHVTREDFSQAKIKAEQKLGRPAHGLRMEVLDEGLCLQALHIGSYDDEGPLLSSLHNEIMPARGYEFAGRHHEIYLSDPRKTPGERLKTLIRQPVRQSRAP